ncbi:uncharacterized protein LOC101860683 [Aplysia californica]|uniref:MICOS complex subunit MIC13 n=1 Tax=Aplysia californica TaxID=6500 RepID=A0ABM1A7Q4_APLCA|nr:uncharacterized protein LOC101860683 [Aplysia californica]
MALSLVKNGTKLALTGGAVYWSVQQGIWGTVQEGSEAMKRLQGSIVPASAEYVEKIPSPGAMSHTAVTNWNTGMKTIFGTASQLPEITGEYSEKASNAVSSLVKGE